MAEQQLKTCSKNVKNPENRKNSSMPSNQVSKKQSKKGDSSARFGLATEQSPDFRCSSTWICKNAACRAVLSKDDVFCRRCSCCICHQFDDNKDPSLWLVCECELDPVPGDYCGFSCHIECAFKKGKLGVVNLGQYMQLDGSYCCASCGKVAGILGYLKKQLAAAKDARRVDVLCYRIFLSYRLLEGTSKFKELSEIVTAAKTKLEAELGPMNGESVKMARGIVSRLAIATEAQKLCSSAIERAEESILNNTVDSLPAACRFLFEEVTSSSLAIVLINIPSMNTERIIGYKLWYCKSREESFSNEPASVFSRDKRRISVTKLRPCTEYTFKIISYTEVGDLGHSEAKCFTGSLEILDKNPSSSGFKKENSAVEGSSSSRMERLDANLTEPSGFRVRDLSGILHLAWAQQQDRLEGFCSVKAEQCCGALKCESPKDHKLPPVCRELDLNVVSVPDLNEDLTPPLESSRDEDNGFTLERATGHDDDAASHGIEKNGLARSNGSGPSDDSHAWVPAQNGDVSAVESLIETRRKRSSSAMEETHDCDSTLINGSPYRISSRPGSLDENFEYCIKSIRMLECNGYIKQDFRLKLLTWFSLRSTEQERRIVNTFIHALFDDPKSLAAQLVDAFGDMVSIKRPRSSFTSIPS